MAIEHGTYGMDTGTGGDNARALDRSRGAYESVITWLVMEQPPSASVDPPPAGDVAIEPWSGANVHTYLALFHRIGDPWLWYGRLQQTRREIEALLHAPDHHVWRLRAGGEVVGLCELDRSQPAGVEIAYFGLVPEAAGRGLGSYFLRAMVAEAWRGDVAQVWLHTCSEDDPRALMLYQRVGFRILRRETEWVHDPRLRGLLPRTAGAHVPIPE